MSKETLPLKKVEYEFSEAETVVTYISDVPEDAGLLSSTVRSFKERRKPTTLTLAVGYLPVEQNGELIGKVRAMIWRARWIHDRTPLRPYYDPEEFTGFSKN